VGSFALPDLGVRVRKFILIGTINHLKNLDLPELSLQNETNNPKGFLTCQSNLFLIIMLSCATHTCNYFIGMDMVIHPFCTCNNSNSKRWFSTPGLMVPTDRGYEALRGWSVDNDVNS